MLSDKQLPLAITDISIRIKLAAKALGISNITYCPGDDLSRSDNRLMRRFIEGMNEGAETADYTTAAEAVYSMTDLELLAHCARQISSPTVIANIRDRYTTYTFDESNWATRAYLRRYNLRNMPREMRIKLEQVVSAGKHALKALRRAINRKFGDTKRAYNAVARLMKRKSQESNQKIWSYHGIPGVPEGSDDIGKLVLSFLEDLKIDRTKV